jgi:hypothetical protein
MPNRSGLTTPRRTPIKPTNTTVIAQVIGYQNFTAPEFDDALSFGLLWDEAIYPLI